ncbi:MAG: hypothetical protein H6867_05635 [Rhodospirillales bacterium]|nr:hypothetical protein [Rhodospirillales bacterium]MCB9995010.1 hypothetical protein [Rhodospirillales bacterium]
MKSQIKKLTTAAALSAAALFNAASLQAQQIEVTPTEAMRQMPACLSFAEPDRGGYKFDDAADHQYDEAMRTFIKNLRSYSGWNALVKQMENAGRPLNGVCMISGGDKQKPINIDDKLGSVDINIYKATSWGDSIRTPQEMQKDLDIISHVTIYTLGSNGVGRGLVSPQLTLSTNAFMSTVAHANGHAEAVLSTIERGLAENRLADIQDILFDASPDFKDEIALLYQKAVTQRTLSDADKSEFQAAVIQKLTQDPGHRMKEYQKMAQMMQALAKQGADVSPLFKATPPDAAVNNILEKRFGADISGMTIDGKPLVESYRDFWANNPNDPAAPLTAQIEQFQQYIGMVIEQQKKQAEEEAAKSQKQAPEQNIAPLMQMTPAM